MKSVLFSKLSICQVWARHCRAIVWSHFTHSCPHHFTINTLEQTLREWANIECVCMRARARKSWNLDKKKGKMDEWIKGWRRESNDHIKYTGWESRYGLRIFGGILSKSNKSHGISPLCHWVRFFPRRTRCTSRRAIDAEHTFRSRLFTLTKSIEFGFLASAGCILFIYFCVCLILVSVCVRVCFCIFFLSFGQGIVWYNVLLSNWERYHKWNEVWANKAKNA